MQGWESLVYFNGQSGWKDLTQTADQWLMPQEFLQKSGIGALNSKSGMFIVKLWVILNIRLESETKKQWGCPILVKREPLCAGPGPSFPSLLTSCQDFSINSLSQTSLRSFKYFVNWHINKWFVHRDHLHGCRRQTDDIKRRICRATPV